MTPEQLEKLKEAKKQRRIQDRERHAAQQREWREKNPERWKEISRAARAKWKAKNRDQHREAQRHHRQTVRIEILVMLGGAHCKHCGFSDVRALQIDHINGGGNGDLRTQGGNTNLWAFRNWLEQNLEEGRKLYQVLCANCNWIKRYK